MFFPLTFSLGAGSSERRHFERQVSRGSSQRPISSPERSWTLPLGLLAASGDCRFDIFQFTRESCVGVESLTAAFTGANW